MTSFNVGKSGWLITGFSNTVLVADISRFPENIIGKFVPLLQSYVPSNSVSSVRRTRLALGLMLSYVLQTVSLQTDLSYLSPGTHVANVKDCCLGLSFSLLWAKRSVFIELSLSSEVFHGNSPGYIVVSVIGC